MNLTKNIICFSKGFILTSFNEDLDKTDYSLAATVQAELMNLGYILETDAFNSLAHSKRDFVIKFYEEIISYLKESLGVDRNYRPFYANFPQQVMDSSAIELFINAIIHYCVNAEWVPPTPLKDRGIAFENVNFKKIKLGTESDFENILTKTVSVNQSITDFDKKIVEWFITNNQKITLPEEIPFKENICILAAHKIPVPIKSPTDVLRIALYMSGGDISLSPIEKIKTSQKYFWTPSKEEIQKQLHQKHRFIKFTRSQRKFILSLLEKTNPQASEMQSHCGRWLRLGEILHPGEYKKAYPLSYKAFSELRNQPTGDGDRVKVRTWNSKVEKAFEEGIVFGLMVLSSRPGEFARRLDSLIRKFPLNIEAILASFSAIQNKVSSKVIFEMLGHFSKRGAEYNRAVMIKGKKSILKSLPSLPPLPQEVIDFVINSLKNILFNRAKSLPFLGDVYIDDSLKNIPLPFSMRSINTSVKTYIRGTKIDLPKDAKVIRSFIHWFDKEGSIDLDLSAALFDKNFVNKSFVSFRCLNEIGCYHSGDIRHRVGPCAEYIDADVDVLLKRDIRYVVFTVNNFNGDSLDSVEKCVFGFMGREFPEANEIFVPKTIENCNRIANESSSIAVCALDLKDKKYIWLDIETPDSIMVHETVNYSLESIINNKKMTVYDLLEIHAKARGNIISSQKWADTVFSFDDFSSDYLKIANYMSL